MADEEPNQHDARSELIVKKAIAALGREGALKQFAKIAGYSAVPPTIDEFLDQEEFGLESFGEGLYPIWRQELQAIFPNQFSSPFLEIQVSGSIGSGKSTFCRTGMAYDLCRLTYMTDIHKKFQIKRITDIELAFINNTVASAQDVLSDKFRQEILGCPYFQKLRLRLPRKSPFLLPPNYKMITASRGTQSMGRAVVMALMSELNFMGASQKDQAVKNYLTIKSRLDSRFKRDKSSIFPGRVWMDSSRSDETGFLENHMRETASQDDVRQIFKAVWEVRKSMGKQKYSGLEFDVFIGDNKRDPMILDKPGAGLGIPAELIIQVPVEHRDSFERNIWVALRDDAGVATWSTFKFFGRGSDIERAMPESFVNPCFKEVVELDPDNPNDQLINYVDLDYFRRLTFSNPYITWYIHFDIGVSNDKTGIALTRMMDEVSVQRHSMVGEFITRDSRYQTDLVMSVAPRPGKEVPIARLRNFVTHLIQNGISIGGASCDQFQSKQMLQELQEAGIRSETISVDRTRDGYENLRDTIIESRWLGPYHPILRREMLALEDHGQKIDHPLQISTKERPSKDIADAVAGSLWFCKLNSAGTRNQEALVAYTKSMETQQKELTIQQRIEDQVLKSKNKHRGHF